MSLFYDFRLVTYQETNFALQYTVVIVTDVPKLPPIPSEPEPEEFREEADDKKSGKNRRPSGPRTPDPYSIDDSSIMLPVFVAIGAFIPLLFCLCKLWL